MRALILMAIMAASMAQAGLEVSRVVRGTQRPSDYVVTNVTLTGVALESDLANSNNWNAAYSWGNHAGLYRDISWVPTWGEVTGKPLLFPPAPHDYSSITNPPWITASQVPAYDNTKIVSINSNHFVMITETNLVMYEIAYSNAWRLSVEGVVVYSIPEFTFPLTAEYIQVILDQPTYDYIEYYADFINATLQYNGWTFFNFSPVDPYTGVAMLNLQGLPEEPNIPYVAQLFAVQVSTTNAIKTFSTTADLNAYCRTNDFTGHTNLSLASGAHGGLPTAAQVGAVGTNDVFRGSVSNSMYKTRLNYQGSAMATYIGFNAFPEWDERTSINGPVRILSDSGSTLGFLDIAANFGSGKFGGGAPFGGIERLNYLYYDYDGAIFKQSDITSGNYVNLIRAGGDSFINGKMSFSNNVFVAGTITASNLVYSTVRWIDAIAAGNTLGGGSTAPQRTEVYAGTGIFAYGYDTTDDSNFSIQCVHGLASTNATFPNLYYSPHAHVSVAALTPPATNATFILKWQVASVTGTYDGYHVKTQTVYFANSHTNFHRLLDFGVYTNNSLEGRDSVMFRGNIARIVGIGDTGNRVIIDSLDYHVPIDTVGSTLINGD